mgnify:CR=1 FL=1
MSDKFKAFRELLSSNSTEFILEAHSGVSAKIVEETGFKGIWASGLSISASLGVRDNNEASYTQILDVMEYMSDVTNIPILLDGDTGYGNYNNARRLVRKLEQRDIAAVCIEDKMFPKTNSFIGGEKQPLADIQEFSGKIKAMKDTQNDSNFSVVARLESFITGWGLESALERATSYFEAGADAILVHSKIDDYSEIKSFVDAWTEDCPIVIVPTKYYTTPVSEFRKSSISLVIWANHMIRTSIASMQSTAKVIYEEESLTNIENKVATVQEIFRLQNAEELKDADNKYLPANEEISAIILAASQGPEFLNLTKNKPKTMVEVNGKPILDHIKSTFVSSGIKNITVIGGYKHESINLDNINLIKNDKWKDTGNVYSLQLAKDSLEGTNIISNGDLIFEDSILNQLIETPGDIVLLVDSSEIIKDRSFNFWVKGVSPPSDEYGSSSWCSLEDITYGKDKDSDAQWTSIMKVSSLGSSILKENFDDFEKAFSNQAMLGDYIKFLHSKGIDITIMYARGKWFDLDSKEDLDVFEKKIIS